MNFVFFIRPCFFSKRMTIEIKLANTRVRLSLRLPETKRYFSSFISRDDCSGWDVRIEEKDIAKYPLICPTGILDPFSEAYLLMPRVSAFILRKQCVLIHGVAFIWQGHAWLMTAPSGTGKTTQLHLLQKILGDEMALINGDKAILSLHKNGEFWLHPSPWTGKENEYGSSSGVLAGIIILEQNDTNSMSLLSPRESVLKVFQQFLIADSSEEELRIVGELESKLLKTIPIWCLKNRGDIESAQLMIHILNDYEAIKDEEV